MASNKLHQTVRKIFTPDQNFPFCPCPTPLFSYAKNTLISCGICDVKSPKTPPHETMGGRAGADFHSGFFSREKIFKPEIILKNLSWIWWFLRNQTGKKILLKRSVLLCGVFRIEPGRDDEIVQGEPAGRIGIQGDIDIPGLPHADIRKMSLPGCEGCNLAKKRDAGRCISQREGSGNVAVFQGPARHLCKIFEGILSRERGGSCFIRGALLVCEFHGYLFSVPAKKVSPREPVTRCSHGTVFPLIRLQQPAVPFRPAPA